METAKNENRMLRNLIHASDTEENARREIVLWFGQL
jgi:nucleoside diphosphate kinase